MQRTAHYVIFFLLIAATSAMAENRTLNNGLLLVNISEGRLRRIEDINSRHAVPFEDDHAVLTVDGKTIDTAVLRVNGETADQRKVTISYDCAAGDLAVVYELRPGTRFVSKQIILTLSPAQKVKVNAVTLVSARLGASVRSERRLAGGKRGVFLRLGEQGAPFGMVAAVQNPFMNWELKDGHMSMAYQPELDWRSEYGAFKSDRACLGIYTPSGHTLPEGMVGEWKYVPDIDQQLASRPQVDQAEVEVLTDIYRVFLLFRLGKTTKIHVGWCENDYQIDVGKPEGRAEYKRIIDQASAVGVDYILYAPANSEVSSLQENRDAWGWENLLWLGLGQKIRKDEWKIETDSIPASIQEMLDYARSKHIGLVAYAYPTVPFMQNPEWTQWIRARNEKPGGYLGPDTGIRSFQDWWMDRLLAFQKRTGIAGYSFDHWWIAYDKSTTSQYAQWYGARRILEGLRQKSPQIVIDGRQQYHWFGTWTWLAGSYPHPLMTDEQPGSFQNFPDLHFARVSGDRQRFASYVYRMQEFCPIEIVPGYMTHQTPRINDKHECPRTRFRAKDWDYLGWKYSVICAIGTAPMQNVVNMLPARDEQEFSAFGKADQAWLRHWLQWADQNQAVLLKLRSIIGPPALGRIDGTAACLNDHGFVFLFNPNYRALASEIRLDGSIGLSKGQEFILKQLYPREGVVMGKPAAGTWSYGDAVPVNIKGPAALVIEVIPAERIDQTLLMNVAGSASVAGGKLVLDGVIGEAGHTIDAQVLLGAGAKITAVSVNGTAMPAFTQNGRLMTVPVTFAGTSVEQCPQVGAYDATFAGRAYKTPMSIPSAVFDQLASRRRAWPVACTPEELRCTWLGPDRLLLYVNIAEPDFKSAAAMRIDGKSVELKKAYSSIATDAEAHTFTGFYADVSDLTPDVTHQVEMSLPELKPGQFQGLFLENVEPIYTGEVLPQTRQAK